MSVSQTSTVIYSDLNSNPVSNGKDLAYNLDAIRQSLDNLFNTPYGSRAWQPTYGNTFEYLIGEPMNDTTAELFLDKVIESVTLHEPRVTLDLPRCVVNPQYEQNSYFVKIVFQVAGVGTDAKFSYEAVILNNADS